MPRNIRIASVNVNGVRAAYRKGMGEWLAQRDVDVLALQEVRATRADLEPLIGEGWHLINDEATAKGRAGVAIASRLPIVEWRTELGPADFDSAGRWIEADFDVDGTPLTVGSVYVHSGEADTPKQEEKWKFLDALTERLPELAKRERVVLLGDFNVGHTELDIKNWKGNVKKAGFLPQERQWLTELLATGWVDVVRQAHPDVAGPYAWWSWRGKAFDNDAGWRIDYQLATPGLAGRVSAVTTERPAAYALRWSDHCPVTVHYA